MQDGELIVHLTRDRVGTGRDPGPDEGLGPGYRVGTGRDPGTR